MSTNFLTHRVYCHLQFFAFVITVVITASCFTITTCTTLIKQQNCDLFLFRLKFLLEKIRVSRESSTV